MPETLVYQYLDVKKYQGKAKHSSSGRTRSFEISAKDLEGCRLILLQKGFVEPFEIVELPTELATQKQKDFANDLKLAYPLNISKREMSLLISKTMDHESDANPELLQYAINRGIIDTIYIGKRSLYNLIFSSLEARDKVAFFLFCVYRYCTDDRYGDLDTHTDKVFFYSLADDLINDSRFMTSMNKYEGQELRYFGTLHVKDANGNIVDHPGGSAETIAYQQAVQSLQTKFTLPLRASHTISSNSIPKTPSSSPQKNIFEILRKICLPKTRRNPHD